MNNKNNEKNKFLYPLKTYRGKFAPNNLAFNANLQEFAQKISYICSLESNGKISSAEAYNKIKTLWQKLEKSKINLLDNLDFYTESE